MHKFDWEYRDTLKNPWYFGLAQGQGLSLLVRAHKITGKKKYLISSKNVFESFLKTVEEGGVTYVDSEKNKWIEEYIVFPPTHILNGFIWALWGIYDYYIYFNEEKAKNLFNSYNKTLINNIKSYDINFWSLYEHSGTNLKMIASNFYHNLHIIQLEILYILTGNNIFNVYKKSGLFIKEGH